MLSSLFVIYLQRRQKKWLLCVLYLHISMGCWGTWAWWPSWPQQGTTHLALVQRPILKIIAILLSRLPTLLLHDLCLEVLNVHANLNLVLSWRNTRFKRKYLSYRGGLSRILFLPDIRLIFIQCWPNNRILQ